MGLGWLDVRPLSFNTLLLLESVQLSWLRTNPPTAAWAVALQANPHVAWYMRHKCPALAGWLNTAVSLYPDVPPGTAAVRAAEIAVMEAINDWLVYVVDPAVYDAQPFLGWDSQELTGLVDFSSQRVLDVGAGTGRLSFTVVGSAAAVFAVEPVWNLRRYLKQKAQACGATNFFVVDGLITDIPFPNDFFDVVMSGHVFGDETEAEANELLRVTRPGGWVILCPGNGDADNEPHRFLTGRGFAWSRFEEPRDGWKRKYWRQVDG